MDDGIYGTAEHLKERKDHAEPSMIELKMLLEHDKDKHPPMGEAIHYALAQWNALTLFLTDARLPVDNNIPERALRAAALGRNYADPVIMRSAALISTGRWPFRTLHAA